MVGDSFQRLWLRATALCLLGQMALSFPLWGWRAAGAVPALPVWGEAGGAEAWWWWLPGLLPALPALLTVVFPDRRLTMTLVLCLLFSALFDINRMQPWVYWYVLVWGVTAFVADPRPVLAWVMPAVYVWSGLHKITPWFAEDNFPWFCDAFAVTRPLGTPALGYLAAVLEALLAPLLWFPRTRHWAVSGALLLHAWIMLVLSPAGLHWNAVVIPWNAAMMATVLYVFIPKNIFYKPDKPFEWMLVVWLFLSPLIPGLPRVFGWHLYNNTHPEATFVRGQTTPSCVTDWDSLAYGNGNRLLLDDWAVRSLGVPLFNSRPVFERLHRYLQGCSSGGGDLEVLEVDWWKNSSDE
ncbi:MAG: hypothetical protein SFV52_15495 [Saprospiraceae bacterium]|nr:hypothetical protein [Saprospiraceae bacterium]